MKLRVDVDGVEYLLSARKSNGTLDYELSGAAAGLQGAASVVALGNDGYSVLLGRRSWTVRIVRNAADEMAVHVAGQRYLVRVSDARDRRRHETAISDGPVDIRSHMPGKVVKLLVELGQEVAAGQGLIVVEAMKMQNEITAPKPGRVKRIAAAEGATVGAGEILLTVV